MFGFTSYERRQIVPNADSLREELLWLMTHDDDFMVSISVSTNKKGHVNTHFKKRIDSLEKIIGTPKVEPRAFSLNYKKQLYDNNPTCRICGNMIH